MVELFVKRYRIPVKRYKKDGQIKEYVVNKTSYYHIDMKKKKLRELIRLITKEIKNMDNEYLEKFIIRINDLKNNVNP